MNRMLYRHLGFSMLGKSAVASSEIKSVEVDLSSNVVWTDFEFSSWKCNKVKTALSTELQKRRWREDS